MVAYVFPPLGGGGVHRTLGFAHHLPGHGWRPTVLCASENSRYWASDPSLVDQIPDEALDRCVRQHIADAGITAASRQGVNVSAGWQLSRDCTYNSAGASAKQITLDHTHYETPIGIEAATSLYGSVFKPTIHSEIYAFEDLPRAVVEMDQAIQTGIPIVRVAEDMPAAVQGLIP